MTDAPSPGLSPGGKSLIYYIDDHLGSAQVVTDGSAGVIYEGSLYPFGMNRGSSDPAEGAASSGGVDYSYTAKERDSETDLVYFGARYYSPETGRWIAPDPSFVDDPSRSLERPLEANLYLFVRNNPVRWIDLVGEAAGDPYFSQHMAAQTAIADINPKSIGQNREYGGYVYRMGDGKFSYTSPVRGERDRVKLPDIRRAAPRGSEIVAYYHTHAAFNPGYDNLNFSWEDKSAALIFSIDAYLGTPAGEFKYFDYSSTDSLMLGFVPTKEGEALTPYFLFNRPGGSGSTFQEDFQFGTELYEPGSEYFIDKGSAVL